MCQIIKEDAIFDWMQVDFLGLARCRPTATTKSATATRTTASAPTAADSHSSSLLWIDTAPDETTKLLVLLLRFLKPFNIDDFRSKNSHLLRLDQAKHEFGQVDDVISSKPYHLGFPRPKRSAYLLLDDSYATQYQRTYLATQQRYRLSQKRPKDLQSSELVEA